MSGLLLCLLPAPRHTLGLHESHGPKSIASEIGLHMSAKDGRRTTVSPSMTNT